MYEELIEKYAFDGQEYEIRKYDGGEIEVQLKTFSFWFFRDTGGFTIIGSDEYDAKLMIMEYLKAKYDPVYTITSSIRGFIPDSIFPTLIKLLLEFDYMDYNTNSFIPRRCLNRDACMLSEGLYIIDIFSSNIPKELVDMAKERGSNFILYEGSPEEFYNKYIKGG